MFIRFLYKPSSFVPLEFIARTPPLRMDSKMNDEGLFTSPLCGRGRREAAGEGDLNEKSTLSRERRCFPSGSPLTRRSFDFGALHLRSDRRPLPQRGEVNSPSLKGGPEPFDRLGVNEVEGTTSQSPVFWPTTQFCNYIIRFLILLLMISPSSASFFEDHARGWHWYEVLLKKSIKKPKNKKEKQNPINVPTLLLKAYRQELERRLHQAILFPTPQNVQAYQEIQKDMMDRAQRFSQVWQQVVFTTPHLDESIPFPASQIARQVYSEQQDKERTQKIRNLSKTHGLFFFFKGNCPYCHAFAPIVKRFSQMYGWEVMAISLDGSTIDAFPEAVKDNGLSQTLNITVVPSLIAANPSENKIIPLSHGLSSEEDIKQRLMVLVEMEGYS